MSTAVELDRDIRSANIVRIAHVNRYSYCSYRAESCAYNLHYREANSLIRFNGDNLSMSKTSPWVACECLINMRPVPAGEKPGRSNDEESDGFSDGSRSGIFTHWMCHGVGSRSRECCIIRGQSRCMELCPVMHSACAAIV